MVDERNMTEHARLLFTKPSGQEASDLNKLAVDGVGELLIKLVRDSAITDTAGHFEAVYADDLTQHQDHEVTDSFDGSQLHLIRRIVSYAVDTTLHHLLWTLDRVEWMDVVVHTESGTVASLREASDGLHGELYDWIPRFSNRDSDNLSHSDRSDPWPLVPNPSEAP